MIWHCIQLNHYFLQRLLMSLFTVKKLSQFASIALLGLAINAPAQAALSKTQQTELDQLLIKYEVSNDFASKALKEAKLQQKIINLMNKPSEGKPWHQYRPIFLGDKRINGGIKFMTKYKKELAKTETTYGVPAEMIAAIIGVETYYGGNKGHDYVLDALYTLGFHYPKRETFFKKEFVEYLKLCQEQNWPLKKVKGSYAGAMGYGQFMPSSYRHYGVDFSGDGKVDMLNDPIDAIGSVANYLAKHGWQANQAIAVKATVKTDKKDKKPSEALALANTNLKSPYDWAQLKTAGVTITTAEPSVDHKLNFLPLEQTDSTDYWLTYENFYVITTYNRSTKYAMAVFQLSQAIKAKSK